MTEKQDLGAILARNIADRRKSAGMTQAELAEKLGYSDKSVSKWERGEGMPDVLCVKRMADLFGVSVDVLLTDAYTENIPAAEGGYPEPESNEAGQKAHHKAVNHWAITAVVVSGTWLLALLLYMIGKFCGVDFTAALVAAVPITGLLGLIFNTLWGKHSRTFWLCTFFVAGILILLCWLFRAHAIWGLMGLTFPAAGVIWFGCRIRKNTDK